MGWKSGAAKGAAIGSSFGLGGAIVGAGVGALLGSSKKVIIVDDEGVYFADKEQTEWADVVNVEAASNDEGDDLFWFKFRGGLRVLVQDDNIQWGDGYREYFIGEESDEEIDISLCDDLDIIDSEIEDIIEAKDFGQILRAIESVLWANELAETLGGTEGLYIDQDWLFVTASMGYYWIRQVSGLEGFGRSQKRKQIISRKSEVASLIKEQLNYIDPAKNGICNVIAGLFAIAGSERKDGIDGQAIQYDNLRNARAYGSEDVDDDMLAEILAAEDDGLMPLGSVAWSKRRKMIVCTEEKAALSIWSEGIKIPGTMVMDAQDIVNYNDNVSDDKRLIFEINHPQNGVTYIQHPMQQNVYIDAESFHSSMLERKYSELIRLLESLGATTITCDVENNNTTDEKRRRKMAVDANVDVPVAGEFSAQYESSSSSSRMQALYKKLQKRIVNRKMKGEKPYVPGGLLFYPFEDDWKNLARSVLKGRRLEEETTLTYRGDFAMTGQRLTSFVAKVKSVIPSYEFGLGGNFSQEFEEELKQLKSTVWHYHVCFGGEQSDSAATTKQLPQEIEKEPIEATTDRDMSVDHEKVFKMIRRLAKSENVQQTGLFSDEQRAAIEAFAQKKGIADDVDDLIEEALG